MSGNKKSTGKNDVAKTEAPKIDIIRGRMPIVTVWLIRFHFEGSDAELARMFRTTPGKINDIKKGRNFGYITEDSKFSKEQLDQALEHAVNLAEDDKAKVMEQVDSMEPATEEEVSKLEELRKASRKPRGKQKEAVETAGAENSDSSTEEVEQEEDPLDSLESILS